MLNLCKAQKCVFNSMRRRIRANPAFYDRSTKKQRRFRKNAETALKCILKLYFFVHQCGAGEGFAFDYFQLEHSVVFLHGLFDDFQSPAVGAAVLSRRLYLIFRGAAGVFNGYFFIVWCLY